MAAAPAGGGVVIFTVFGQKNAGKMLRMEQKSREKMKEKREKSTSLLEKIETIWYDNHALNKLFTIVRGPNH